MRRSERLSLTHRLTATFGLRHIEPIRTENPVIVPGRNIPLQDEPSSH